MTIVGACLLIALTCQDSEQIRQTWNNLEQNICVISHIKDLLHGGIISYHTLDSRNWKDNMKCHFRVKWTTQPL